MLAAVSVCLMMQGFVWAGVMPIVPPQTPGTGPSDVKDIQSRIYQSIEKQARNVLTKVHLWEGDPTLKLITESKHEEHWIRPNTGAVIGLSFLCRFGPYDENITGVSKETLLNGTILPMMRYLIAIHLTGNRTASNGKQWGSQWQSAHWAHMLGRGAWWIWADLPPDVREGVCKVVAHEADRIEATTPPSAIDNDTKSEENAWNSQILSVAVTLMPEDARRAAWEQAFQKWALSSYLRPADKSEYRVVDGKPVCEQFTGANIHDDFTVENHGRVHPDYMSCFTLSMACLVDFRMSGRTAPQAVFYNTSEIYENLKWFALPGGGFLYPNGQDWELMRDPEWFFLHTMMASQAGDPDAWQMAKICLGDQEKMQARSDSGTVFLDDEYFFPSTLSDLIYYDAMAWLALEYRNPIKDRPEMRQGVRRLDGGKLILNRTPASIHAFSWNVKFMAQVVSMDMDRVTSPHPLSGFGHIRISGKEDELSPHLRSADVHNTSRGFKVKVEADYGGIIDAIMTFRSKQDGSWKISEKLMAHSDMESEEIATGLIGILNNPHWIYERGERSLSLDGKSYVIPSGSGIECQAKVNTLAVDDRMQIRSTKPLHIHYCGATKADRCRYTDELYLNYSRGQKSWKAGDVISTFSATVSFIKPSKPE